MGPSYFYNDPSLITLTELIDFYIVSGWDAASLLFLSYVRGEKYFYDGIAYHFAWFHTD